METPVLGLDKLSKVIQISRSRVISYRTHSHMFNEMLFYDKFDGHVTVNQRNIDAENGLLLLVTPTDFHSTTLNSRQDAYYTKINFRSDFPGNAFGAELCRPLMLRNFQDDPFLSGLRTRCESATDDRSRAIILNAILLELTEKGEELDSICISTNGLAFAAMRIISERFTEKLTLDSIANELHVTPPYLSTLFTKRVGMTFSAYLREKRLNYAAELLIGSENSVTDICFISGFGNLSHFVRCFERRFGMSPTSFRRFHPGE